MIRNNYPPFNDGSRQVYKVPMDETQTNGLNMNLLVNNWTKMQELMAKENDNYGVWDEWNSNYTYFGYKEDGSKHFVNVIYIKQYTPFGPFYADKLCEWANVYLF